MRVGVFDPAFKEVGHFIPFDAYIADLAASFAREVVFFDATGAMERAYGSRAFAVPVSFVRLPEPVPSASRIMRILRRFRCWRSRFVLMDRSCDLLVITAEARDPLMYFSRPRVPYLALILFPYAYLKEGYRSVAERIVAGRYRAFVRGSAAYFTTSESPMLEAIRDLLGLPYLDWLPNLPVRSSSEAAGGNGFVTLGTISRSKSHAFVLQAFRERRLPYPYHIAGAALDETGESVRAGVEALAQEPDLAVTGEFSYLSDERYESLLRSAAYALFPYDFTRGNISSQVLHDCFRTRTPIVAPAIEPFKGYVERYGIGFLYPEGDAEGLAEALAAASRKPKADFADGFSALARDLSFERIAERFRERVLSSVPGR